MASTSSGARRPLKRYMASRQVQKWSSPDPRRSVSPAKPRWNVWLWRLPRPGTAMPPRSWSVGSRGSAPTSTVATRPSAIPTATASCQPSGVRADSKKSLCMGAGPTESGGIGRRFGRTIAEHGVIDKTRMDRLWRHARIATLDPKRPGLGIIEDGAVATRDGRIAYVGPDRDLPAGCDADLALDCGGRLVTPGLIDCHTHLVFGGHRAHEFEMRLQGATYQEIARAGGGILSSVEATRAASVEQLVASALPRLDALLAEGVTGIEIKSGYGLDLESERKMLAAARRLATLRDVAVHTSFLGAHALPPEAEGDRDRYIALVCGEMLPTLAAEGLVDAVDGFCETIAFSPAQCARVFDTAARLGLPVKLHADQLTDGGGAGLAARYGALSADHLEYTEDAGAAAMAAAGCVAVVLPGAYYFLREPQAPPVDLFRKHGFAWRSRPIATPARRP